MSHNELCTRELLTLFAPELMVGAKVLPPTIWWTWAEGTWPGSTRGSRRWMLIVEQPKRRAAWEEAARASKSEGHCMFGEDGSAMGLRVSRNRG
jgi:hypothetical protein